MRLMGLLAVITIMIGSDTVQIPPQTHTQPRHATQSNPVGEWMVQHVESLNGPSLTGYARTDVQLVPVIQQGSIRVLCTGVRRMKIGLVQIREFSDWQDYHEAHGQSTVFGVGFDVRF